jgi:hypothetical protein
MHGRGGVMEWIGRIRAAAEWTNTTWLVVLEDDVRVDGRGLSLAYNRPRV